MSALLLPLYDLITVVIFAAVGRRNHGEGGAVTGIMTTAWPFLVGAFIGWLLVLGARRCLEAGARLPSGVVVWLSTVVVGMLLRHLDGRGVAVSFIIVTLIFNGLMMLGWRALRAFSKRRNQHS